MPNEMSPLVVEEYRALRETIRQRGSLRLLVIAVTFVSWVAAALAVVLLSSQTGTSTPLVSVLPLALLASGFEVILATHVGVERVGCYLEVYYEANPPTQGDGPSWERTVKAVGAMVPTPGVDPLCGRLFTVAAMLNLTPALIGGAATLGTWGSGVGVGLAGAMLLHAAFLARLSQATRFSRQQRAADLAAFRALKRSPPA